MPDRILFDIVTVVLLGVGAQWLAWRLKIPSILLLLVFGFLAGPVTGLLGPAALQGDWVFAFVSVSIGIILFEGGLSLRLSELREIGKAVRNLITVGVLVTWVLAAVAAYYILDFSLPLSILLGAILTVTGPTVVIPLLRHVRPTGRIGAVARWEGITIDPVGAILAVLVLEAITLLHDPVAAADGHTSDLLSAIGHTLEGLFLEFFISVGVSLTGAALLIITLRRRLVPDYLETAVTLGVVVAMFALSNYLQHESGLLTVTLMGIMLANQQYVPVRHIIEFKENLTVLLIGSLFILLSARLELSALAYLNAQSVLFLGALILLVRPAAVLLSAVGTKLDRQEIVFLSWLAPRGIVAAAVAALFSFRLEAYFPDEVGALVPVVFLVIVGTVAIYGLSIAPVARWLGLAQPDPQGVLFVGAHAWARRIAAVLDELDVQVLLIDSNPENVRQAEQQGLRARAANALSETVVDELDLAGIGRMVALTPNDEVNSLAALHFAELFERGEVFQLAARQTHGDVPDWELPQHLRGRPAFGEGITYRKLDERIERGDEVRVYTLDDAGNLQALLEHAEDAILPLFLVRSSGKVEVVAEWQELSAQAGDRLVALANASFEPAAAAPSHAEAASSATCGPGATSGTSVHGRRGVFRITPCLPLYYRRC